MMASRIVHGLVMVILVLALSAPARAGQVLKILTLNFNSENFPNDSNYQIRDHRFEKLVDWVHQHDPDLIALQEAWNYRGEPSVGIPLSQSLDYDLAYRLDVGVPGVAQSSTVLLAKKKFHLTGAETLKLPHSAADFGNGQTWTFSLGPVTYLVGAKLTLEDEGRSEPIYYFSTHLLGANGDERLDQATAIYEEIRARIARDGFNPDTTKVILLGDLNSPPHSRVSQYLRENGFDDSWAKAHPDDLGKTDCANPDEPYFNPFSIGAGQFPDQSDEKTSNRIDYVYMRGEGHEVLASTLVFTLPNDGIWMSDHYGLMSVIGLNGARPADIPNPARDSDDNFRPTILTVDDSTFDCGIPENYYACQMPLPDLEVQNLRGLVIKQRLSMGALRMSVVGPERVLTRSLTLLGSGDAAAFSFLADGDYFLSLKDEQGHQRRATIHVAR